MAFYAVRKGRKQGVFDGWESTKPLVHKFKGATFAKFATWDEAACYLKAVGITPPKRKPSAKKNALTPQVSPSVSDVVFPRNEAGENEIRSLTRSLVSLARDGMEMLADDDEDVPSEPTEKVKVVEIPPWRQGALPQEFAEALRSASRSVSRAETSPYEIFTDGSSSKGRYGWGFVVYKNGEPVYRDGGGGMTPDGTDACSVLGETEAVMHAVMFAKANMLDGFRICYDCAGIQTWILHGRKSKNDAIRRYSAWMAKEIRHLDIAFKKVKAHSGIAGNEEADGLAKESMRRATV